MAKTLRTALPRRRYLVGAVASFAVVVAVALFAFHATSAARAQTPTTSPTETAAASPTPAAAPAGPTNDPSGNNTGTGSDLVGVAPGTITTNDFTTAQKNEPFAVKLADMVNQNRLGINFTWTLVTGFLVMFMQAGFALVETGFCRAKSALHVMMTNFMIYGLGMLGYFVCGFAFQEGGVGIAGVSTLGGLANLNKEWTWTLGGVHWGILGYKGFFLTGTTYDVGIAVMFLFQMVFMDTAATIPTGAMAERWKWMGFCIYGLFIGGDHLPRLRQLGLGRRLAVAARVPQPRLRQRLRRLRRQRCRARRRAAGRRLAGAMVLGPRLGKFNKDGTANAIPGHNIILAALGTFILAFGWFGFNPGSTLGASANGNLRIGIIATNTMLAGMSGSIVAMCDHVVQHGKPDAGMMINGLLAGLVAITAPSGFVSPSSSVVIGAIAGGLVVYGVAFFENVLKIDDPVGAISVHGVNGMWGQISLGIFADGTANYGGLTAKGALFGDWGSWARRSLARSSASRGRSASRGSSSRS